MKLKKAKLIALIAFFSTLVAAAGLAADSKGLKKTTNDTVVDGVVRPDEYSYSREFKDSTLHVNWSGGKVYIALTAKTEGWVGVGYGSKMMNNSYILIGYVDRGTPVFKEQVGRGHKHTDTDTQYVQSFEMSEKSGSTTLEMALDEDDIILSGQRSIDFIIAYGKNDSFSQYHGGEREGFSVSIVN